MLFRFILLHLFMLFYITDVNSQTINKSSCDTCIVISPDVDSLTQLREWTNDFEGIFTNNQRKTLDSTIDDFKKRTSFGILIISIDTAMVTKENFEYFISYVLNQWEIMKEEKLNAVIIGISTAYRIIRISYGDEIATVLSDAESQSIIDNDFIPFYKHADYYGGTLNGLQALILKLNDRLQQ